MYGVLVEETKRIHHFNADANSFGGALEHPLRKIVPSQAGVSLPTTGGVVSNRSERFCFEEIATLGASYTHASGGVSPKNGAWTTLVTSVVEDLNILNVVTADRIVAQISLEHPLVGYEPKVTFVGSNFVNLRIGGFPINPVINLGILTPGDEYPKTPWTRHEGFLKSVREQHRQREIGGAMPKLASERYGYVESKKGIEERGHIVCSLVDRLEGTIPGKSFGHIVEIAEYGKFFFGELLVQHGSFRLTMLRAELGCGIHGMLSGPTSGGGGGTYP
jgi:hypothetical protein